MQECVAFALTYNFGVSPVVSGEVRLEALVEIEDVSSPFAS